MPDASWGAMRNTPAYPIGALRARLDASEGNYGRSDQGPVRPVDPDSDGRTGPDDIASILHRDREVDRSTTGDRIRTVRDRDYAPH